MNFYSRCAASGGLNQELLLPYGSVITALQNQKQAGCSDVELLLFNRLLAVFLFFSAGLQQNKIFILIIYVVCLYHLCDDQNKIVHNLKGEEKSKI